MALGDKKRILMEEDIGVVDMVPDGSITAAKLAADVDYKAVNAAPAGLSTNLTLYVATTGSDETGKGSQSNPFATIQHAVDSIPKLTNGKSVVIQVAPGTYAENVQISGFAGSVNIFAQDENNKPVISGHINGTATGSVYLDSLIVEGKVFVSLGCVMNILRCEVHSSGSTAVNCTFGGTVYIDSCTVTATATGNYEGAILAQRGCCYVSSTSITEETVMGLSAVYGTIFVLGNVTNNAQTEKTTYAGKIFT